jgi:hypothetical protein
MFVKTMFMKTKFMKATFMKAMCQETIVAAALILILMAGGATGKASAQDSSPAKAAPEAEKTVNSYRLDFAVNEFEDGKKINTRQYSMNLNAEDQNRNASSDRVQTGRVYLS